jgi:hypothetical protein
MIPRMAGRSNIEKRGAWGDSIKTTLVLKKLHNHVLIEPCMDASQVQAARILLAKTLPDLKAVEHTGDVALKVTAIERIIVRC